MVVRHERRAIEGKKAHYGKLPTFLAPSLSVRSTTVLKEGRSRVLYGYTLPPPLRVAGAIPVRHPLLGDTDAFGSYGSQNHIQQTMISQRCTSPNPTSMRKSWSRGLSDCTRKRARGSIWWDTQSHYPLEHAPDCVQDAMEGECWCMVSHRWHRHELRGGRGRGLHVVLYRQRSPRTFRHAGWCPFRLHERTLRLFS
ncbi:hypothetical protein BC628DRAFT_111235 [Trametes gibbosa]|nr:hypothetical protein BC628DRAFT_111235 [Trametes gibbosa]